MRNYTDEELLNRMKSLPSFKFMPKQLVIGVRSKDDQTNIFDDKLYVFINKEFKLVTSCTTHPGGPILMGGWKKFNKDGAAILKTDEVYHDAYLKTDGSAQRPHHNGKMQCLRQVKPMYYFRDSDNDGKAEEIGQKYFANYQTNIHFNSYNLWNKIKNQFIGDWSAGCQVMNDSEDYNKFLSLFDSDFITYCLLKEF